MKKNKYFVRYEKVKKTYDGKEYVVKELDLDIEKGEFVTMLGPSGSGKTTCLMMVAGFEDITSGDIFVGGKSIKSIAPHKRNIGMVFQNYALFPHMNVGENLAYPLKFRKYKKKEIRERVDKYLSLVELDGFKSRRIGQLSGGQKQRVALARALIYEPELVLMDEPLGALDKNLREQMQYEIKKLHSLLDFTVIYVTHDQAEALTMSDRIAVFNDGVVQQVSTPKKLYEEPENKFVAEFIGENNHFNGVLTQIKKKFVLVKVFGKSIVQALSVNLSENTKEIYVSIRPERVVLNPKQTKVECDNVFTAKVADIIYIGDHLRVYVQIAGWKEQVVIKQHNFGTHGSLRVGSKVEVGWNSNDCRALGQ